MALIVQKFGGSSVADAQRVSHVAGIIANTYRQGNQVVVLYPHRARPRTISSPRPRKSIPTRPSGSWMP